MSFLDQLRAIGRGAQTGLGAALTPVAMAMAARGGRDPFEILRQQQGGQDPLNPLQQAQLQQAKQAMLVQQMTASQDPAARAFLLQNPDAAAQMGFPVGSRSEAIFTRGEPGTMLQPDAVMGPQRTALLPPAVDTTDALRRQQMQANTAWLQSIRGLVSGDAAGGQGLGAAGGMPGGMSVTGLTAGGPVLGYPPPLTVEQGSVGPTGQPIQPQERIGNRQVIIKPSKIGYTTTQRIKLIDAAINGFQTLYATPINSTTGAADPAGQLIEDYLPANRDWMGAAGAVSELAPGLAGAANRLRGRYGSKGEQTAMQTLRTGEGTVVTFVKALGDAGNVAQMEQQKALNAFLPQTGDTREIVVLKKTLTPRVLAALRDELATAEQAGTPISDEEAGVKLMQAAAQTQTAIESTAGAAPSPPATTAPTPAALNAARRALGLPTPLVR
jgi:hypothetical protein